jgi:hypothetical protein
LQFQHAETIYLKWKPVERLLTTKWFTKISEILTAALSIRFNIGFVELLFKHYADSLDGFFSVWSLSPQYQFGALGGT